MKQQNGGGVTGTFVDEMEAELGAIGGSDVAVARFEVVPIEPSEAFVRSAQNFHAGDCLSVGSLR